MKSECLTSIVTATSAVRHRHHHTGHSQAWSTTWNKEEGWS